MPRKPVPARKPSKVSAKKTPKFQAPQVVITQDQKKALLLGQYGAFAQAIGKARSIRSSEHQGDRDIDVLCSAIQALMDFSEAHGIPFHDIFSKMMRKNRMHVECPVCFVEEAENLLTTTQEGLA